MVYLLRVTDAVELNHTIIKSEDINCITVYASKRAKSGSWFEGDIEYMVAIVNAALLASPKLYRQCSLFLALIGLSDTDRIKNGQIGRAQLKTC